MFTQRGRRVGRSGPGRFGKVPAIDVPDLYDPPQDPDVHCNLMAGRALLEAVLQALTLDTIEGFRRSVPDMPGMYATPEVRGTGASFR